MREKKAAPSAPSGLRQPSERARMSQISPLCCETAFLLTKLKMVRHKQPKSLYALSHKRFSEYLGNKVVRAGYDGANNKTLSAVRLKLRPFFVEQIPVVVRTSLLEETADFLFQKSLNLDADCDYGRSILYLLHLLLSKEIKRLKVTLCCYYGCRDMEGVLRCIKKNGSSLEHLELTRSSLLRDGPTPVQKRPYFCRLSGFFGGEECVFRCHVETDRNPLPESPTPRHFQLFQSI